MRIYWIMSLIVGVSLSAGSASATLYLHRTHQQVLANSDLIIKATVIQNIPTQSSRYDRACTVYVDQVLSGTLKTHQIRIERRYVGMRRPREEYKTSESLVLCLRKPDKSDNYKFEIVGLDGEGEFPLVNGSVWIRMAPFETREKTSYTGEDLVVRKTPYDSFSKLIEDLKATPQADWIKLLSK